MKTLLITTLLLLSVNHAFASERRELAKKVKEIRIFTDPSWCHFCRELEDHLNTSGKFNQDTQMLSLVFGIAVPVKTYITGKLSEDYVISRGFKDGAGIPQIVIIGNNGRILSGQIGYTPNSDLAERVINLVK